MGTDGYAAVAATPVPQAARYAPTRDSGGNCLYRMRTLMIDEDRFHDTLVMQAEGIGATRRGPMPIRPDYGLRLLRDGWNRHVQQHFHGAGVCAILGRLQKSGEKAFAPLLVKELDVGCRDER